MLTGSLLRVKSDRLITWNRRTLYTNTLISEIDVEVSIGDSKISILSYADDIVLLSDSPYGIQQQ